MSYYIEDVRPVVTRHPTFAILLLIALAGCKDAKQLAPLAQPAAPTEWLDVTVVAPLEPARPTHVARGDDGTIWWVQEAPEGGGAASKPTDAAVGDVVFALAPDGVPRATSLNAGRILAALGLRDAAGDAGAGGNIQSIAAGRDGRVWFHFTGGAGRRAVSAIGSFDERDGTIRIAARPDELSRVTGMGASLVLARGALVRDGAAGSAALWAWLRHSDGSALLRLDTRSGALTKPFAAVRDGATPLAMTRQSQALAAAPSGSLLLLDVPAVELWRIDVSSGAATSLHPLSGLSTLLSGPVEDRAGRVLFFAADAPLIPARSAEEAVRPVLPARYPAMLVLEHGALRAIDRDAMRLPAGVTPDTLRVGNLIDDPAAGAVLGYDEGSGYLLRFRIVPSPGRE